MPGPENSQKNPSHVGEVIKNEILVKYGLSVTEAAKILGVSRPALSTMLNARSGLSPIMALRFEKAFDVKMDTLLGVQTSYKIAQMRRRAAKIKVRRWSGLPQQANA